MVDTSSYELKFMIKNIISLKTELHRVDIITKSQPAFSVCMAIHSFRVFLLSFQFILFFRNFLKWILCSFILKIPYLIYVFKI